jgi:hypothetical protein
MLKRFERLPLSNINPPLPLSWAVMVIPPIPGRFWITEREVTDMDPAILYT